MERQLRIVDANGVLALYQGKPMVFEASDRERAEMILWLLRRAAVNGQSYRLEESA